MKTVIGFLNFFAMLVASVNASASALPKPAKILHKGNTPGNKLHDAYFNFINENKYTIDADSSENAVDIKYKSAIERLKLQAASVRQYATANNFNTEYCFLVDMSLPSGKNRFFVYNIKKDIIENASLVAHGFGSTVKNSEDALIFSNNNYSFKTSLGRYKIGHSYNGAYGLAFKLYGLDSTNNKAYERAIVLHADVHIPESETYPNKIFQSAGCPTVSPGFLPVLSNYIKTSKKPVLMWIYN